MNWTLQPAADFPAWAERWRALHAAAGAHALLDVDFVAPLLAEFGAGAELLACCEQDGALQAMALLAPRGRAGWATFQPAQAPIGLWLQRPGVALEPLLAGLTAALPCAALMLSLTQCDPQMLARPPHSARLATLDYIATAKITLASGFDAFWAARGKNLRANLKKQRAKIAQGGAATRLEISTEAADMAAAVEDFGRLESAGWKAAEGTAVRAGDAQGRFYRAMLEAFARRDAALVYRYWIGGQLAAMDLCVRDGDSVIVLKTSYDERQSAGLSPALLMREEACRDLFARPGLERIEFYGKVMEWHLRWTDEVRTLYHVNFYRWPLLARWHARWRGRHAAPTPETP